MKFVYKNYGIEIEPALMSFHVLIMKDGKFIADGRELFQRRMKLRTLSQLQDHLDREYSWRLKEISDIKLTIT